MTSAQRVFVQPGERHRPRMSPTHRGHDRMHRLLLVENDQTARAVLTRELRVRDFDVLAVDASRAARDMAGELNAAPDAVAIAVDDRNHAMRGGRPLRVRLS